MIAIVTGAARGIGAAAAVELAARGMDLVLVDRLPADRTLARIAETGRRAFYVGGSVTDRAPPWSTPLFWWSWPAGPLHRLLNERSRKSGARRSSASC